MAILLAHWRYVLMAVLVAAIGVQTVRLRWTQEGLAAAQVQLANAEARITALGAQIDRQNAAVDGWRAAADRAAQAGRRAREEAGRVVAEHRRSADALAAAVAAPVGGLTCGDAVQIVRSDLFQ